MSEFDENKTTNNETSESTEKKRILTLTQILNRRALTARRVRVSTIRTADILPITALNTTETVITDKIIRTTATAGIQIMFITDITQDRTVRSVRARHTTLSLMPTRQTASLYLLTTKTARKRA